jgi:hypothetical protein
MFEESCTSSNSCLYTDVMICEHCLHRNCFIETLEEAASTISAMQSLFADDEKKRDGLLGFWATRVQRLPHDYDLHNWKFRNTAFWVILCSLDPRDGRTGAPAPALPSMGTYR